MWKAIASILVLASSSLAAQDWAGEYSRGFEFGPHIRIRVTPQADFTYSWSGYLGFKDVNFGPAVVRGNRLGLRHELPNDDAHRGVPSEFQFEIVRWGQRIYLLPEEELGPFVNAVNSGREPHKYCIPSCSPFLVRTGDDEKPVSGTPDLPAEYRRRLLDKPITARVVRVLSDETEVNLERGYGWRTIQVEINLGSVDGVWEGMELYASANPHVDGGFEVVQTQEHSSVAINQEVSGPEVPALEPGFCVSTRPGERACPDKQSAALR
jgi:hypothetical protein